MRALPRCHGFLLAAVAVGVALIAISHRVVPARAQDTPMETPLPRPTDSEPFATMEPRAGDGALMLPVAYNGYVWTELPFSLQLIPAVVGSAVGDQRCVFLVTVAEGAVDLGPDDAVVLTATAAGTQRVSVEPHAIRPGQVAEVTVVPVCRLRS